MIDLLFGNEQRDLALAHVPAHARRPEYTRHVQPGVGPVSHSFATFAVQVCHVRDVCVTEI